MINREQFKEKYWKDPVWSKIISFGIISISTFILTTIYAALKSLYEQTSFSDNINEVFKYLGSNIEINAFLFWTGFLVLSIFLFLFIKSIIQKFKSKSESEKSSDELNKNEEELLPRTGMNSTALFSYKLSGAFPGHRGFQWYNTKEAVIRLEKFFEPPLKYEPIADDATSTPFWWFRDISSMYIDKFKKLNSKKVLIGKREFRIKRIGVYVSQSYYKSFIYVETSGENQTGLYNYSEKDILNHIESFGYSFEEYAIFKNKKISREHYDDGATVIKGKVVDAFGSELRVRFLTDYNFLIAASQSPYNSNQFERESGEYFNGILKGDISVESFIEYLKSYEKNPMQYY